MKKIILILPYFGKFKSYFQLFLKTIENNAKNVDLLLFTDNDLKEYTVPSNVIVKHSSFEEFKNMIEQRFDQKICLDRPYKLCDYKPAYGFLFEDMIKDYQYWGHCDCDLVFGDFGVIDDLLEKKYRKLFAGGHLTLYLNNHDNNRVFMKPLLGEKIYKVAINNNKIYCLDEDYFQDNVHSIFLQYYPDSVYSEDISFNVSTRYYDFRRCKYDNSVRKWRTVGKNCKICLRDGKVFSVDKKHRNTEYLYAHFQARNFEFIVVNDFTKAIYFEPNRIYNDNARNRVIKENFISYKKRIKKFAQRVKGVFVDTDPKTYKNGLIFLNRKEGKQNV